MAKLNTKLLYWTAYIIAAFVIIAALLVSVGRLLTPYFNSHLPNFEQFASEALHTPVSIGKVQLSWNIYEPELSFYQVVFLNNQTKKPAIEVKHLAINFRIFSSLFHRQLLIEQIRAEGATLTIRAQTNTKISLDGLTTMNVMDNETNSSTKADMIVNWVCSVPNLYLENINLHWIPLQGKESFFTIKYLALDNSLFSHALDGHIILNQPFETQLFTHVKWEGALTDLAHIKSQFYIYVKGVDLSQWASHLTFNKLAIQQGVGSVKIWGDYENNAFQKIQTTLQFYSLKIIFLVTQKIIELPRISGEFGWRINGQTETIAGDQVFIDFAENLWPATGFSFTYQRDRVQGIIPKAIKIDYVNIDDAKQMLLDSGLLNKAWQKTLTTFNPSGEIKNVNGTFLTYPITLEHMTLAATFSDLSLNAVNNYPGIDHLNSSFDWDKMQGHLFLNSQHTTIHLDQVFGNPITAALNGQFVLQKNLNGDWLLTTNRFTIENQDIQASPGFSLTFPANNAPTKIDLAATFIVKNVAHISDYLPLKIFHADLVTWLRHAFLGGRVESGKAILQGNLKDFPYDEHPGKFLITGSPKNIVFRYAPDWPLMSRIGGTLTFSDRSMVVDVTSGEVLGLPIQSIHGVIPSMGGALPEVLTVDGNIQGDISAGLRFIHASPLEKTIGKQFSKLLAEGPMQLKLGLTIPLKTPETTKVNGALTIKNNTLTLPAWKIRISNLTGLFSFTENTIIANDVQGNLFNFPMTLNISTTRFINQTNYVNVLLQSSLDVPTIEQWVGFPVAQFAEGKTNIVANIHLFSENKQPTEITVKSDLKGMALKLPAGFSKKADEALDLTVKILSADHQMKTDILYKNMTLGVQSLNPGFEISIESPNIVGKVTIPNDKLIGPIQGNFDHIYIDASDSIKGATINPKSIPPLAIVAQQVRIGDKNLGRVVLNTASLPNGLSIRNLQVTTSFVNVSAKGEWLIQNDRQASHIQGTISTTTINDLLRAWNYSTSDLVGSKANATFNLSWADAIYSPDTKNMSGDISFELGEGRIVNLSQSSNAKMDLGRLLNIFNLNTIPRRLSLDFSDITQKGYSFDSIKGYLTIRDGNAYTTNTRLNGPIAGISISGRIGFAAKDFDLTMAVTPYVTSGLPIVAAAAATGGAALVVGAATWVADKLFVGKEVSKAITHQYKITGSWNNPKVESVGAAH